MALQILSDLHLESPKSYDLFDITPRAPYLALLGDIGNVAEHGDDLFSFLRKQLALFEIVFFVPGNHKAYGANWADTLNRLQSFEQDEQGRHRGTFVLLHRRAYPIPGSNVVLLGCSLFSRIEPEHAMAVEMGLRDFYRIDGWGIKEHNEQHKGDLAWLNAEVEQRESSSEDCKLVILTHWSPSRDPRASDPRHKDSPITSGFATDLTGEACLRSGCVKLWAFGHTHFNCDFEMEREGGREPLRVVANQSGYYFAQAEGFNGEKVIDVS